MSSDTRKPPPKPSPADARKARLKQALRDNLRRRKAQMRGRTGAPEPAGGDQSAETGQNIPGTAKEPQS